MLKMEYLLNEGASIPDGATVVECDKCHRKFAVPTGATLLMGDHICEECAPAVDQENAAAAAAEMKNDQPAELQAAIGD